MERVWVIIANSEDGYGGPGIEEMLGFWTTEEAANKAIALLMETYTSGRLTNAIETSQVQSLHDVELRNGEQLEIGGGQSLERQRVVNIVKFIPALELKMKI